MQPAAFVPLCLHAGGIRRALPHASTSQKHVDIQLGEGLTDKISPRSPRAKKPRGIPRAKGWASRPSGGTAGVPRSRGWGFPKQTNANAGANAAGKK